MNTKILFVGFIGMIGVMLYLGVGAAQSIHHAMQILGR
jgi:hypothetical protein